MKKLLSIVTTSVMCLTLSLTIANAAVPNTIGEDGSWTQPSNGDEVQQVENVTVTLTSEEELYDSKSLEKSGYSISPQTVKIIAMVQAAFEINTWLGVKWISPKGKIIYNLEASQQTITLPSKTPIYDFPNVNEHQVGELSPQTIKTFEKAVGGWYHLKTWLGDKWIKPVIADPTDVVKGMGTIEPIMGVVYQYPNINAKQIGSIFGLTTYYEKTNDGWYHIHTANGDGWFQTDEKYLPETIDETITLKTITPIYSNPGPESGKGLGWLSPQTVRAFEKWQNFYKIHSWNGDAWLYVEPSN